MRLVGLAAALLLAGCPGEEPRPQGSSSLDDAPTAPPSGVAPPLPTGARSAASAKLEPARQACAPSLSYRSPLDARDASALERCQSLRTGQAKASLSCGLGDRRARDRRRLLESVPPLSDGARARARRVFELGKTLGRKPDVFGLVGDSITVSTDFLSTFSTRGRHSLDEASRAALTLPDGRTVIELFQGGVGETDNGVPLDPFRAFRAAKVGASASWALEGGEQSPLEVLVRRLSPAFAVVTFGANDAASMNGAPEVVADKFEQSMLAIVAKLEERGVVVILSGEMRHGDAPGVKACPRDGAPNDWTIAVNTNATVARAAEIACREALPFIDLRHALDAATNHGLGPDGVHLSSFQQGSGTLDERGLDCGYNIRSFVTLLALKRVVEAVTP